VKIDIRSAGQRLTGLLLEHVVQRVRDLLAHRRHRIRNVSVRLMDLGGANGGPDQRCVVQIKLHRLPAVVAEETQADARVAIDRALSRAGRAVSRRLESAHAGSQNVPPGHKPVPRY
jgi:ribosome-associated translation inhibitor RaiA